MDTLAASLIAHQQAAVRRPALSLTLHDTTWNRPRLHWSHLHTGSEPNGPVAACLTENGTLFRAWNDAGDIIVSRTTEPAGSSPSWSASSVATGTPGTGVALVALPGEILLFYVANSGAWLQFRNSTDFGETWSGFTTIATDTAISWIAAAANIATGNAIVFYVVDSGTDLKRIRRTSGSWGSGASWPRDIHTISGVSAWYTAGNAELVITGTADTTERHTAWGILFGDGALPADFWGSLVPILDLDADSTSAFNAPSLANIIGQPFATLGWQETGDVAFTRAFITHPTGDSVSSATWLQPYPTEAENSHGAAITTYPGEDDVFLVSARSVWHARLAASRDLSPRLGSASWAYSPTGTRGRFTLDDHRTHQLQEVTNLHPNGGFESNTNFWSSVNGTGTIVISRTTLAQKFHAASLQIDVTSGQHNVSRVQTARALNPNTTYTVSFWLKPSENGAFNIRALGQNGNMGLIAGPTSAGTDWQRLVLTFNTKTSTSIRFDCNVTKAGLTGISYLDGMQIELGDTAHPYVETDGATATQTLPPPLAPAPGMDLRLSAGYASGVDGAAQAGEIRHFRIERVRRSFRRDGRRTIELHCTGPWEALDHWRSPIVHQFAQGEQTRLALFNYFAGRAGVPTAGNPTGWGTHQPGFALNPGESARAAVERLMAPTAAVVRHETGALFALNPPASVEYDYGPGEHPIFEAHALHEADAVNWLRLQAEERYADAYHFDALAAHGPRFAVLRRLDATTDALAEEYSSAALERRTRLTPHLEITVPYHAGQRLYDIVHIEVPELNVDDDFRVVALTNRFERAPGPATYTTTLQLAAVG